MSLFSLTGDTTIGLIYLCERQSGSSRTITQYIHVNPPSFVQSLRHFRIVENLHPGDENLRHLMVTWIFKKCVYFVAINNKNAT